MISEKTRVVLARLRANSGRVSRCPPCGFRTAPGAQLETELTEQAALPALTALSGSGYPRRISHASAAARMQRSADLDPDRGMGGW